MEEMFLDKIKKYLLKEEKILWAGQADRRKVFNIRDLLFIPFSIIMGRLLLNTQANTFNMFIEVINGRHVMSGNDIIKLLFLLVFLFFVLYWIVGRFIAKIYYKGKIIYAVTDKRILILLTGEQEKFIAKYINKLRDIDISVSRSGIGTITFGERSFYNRFYGNTYMNLPCGDHIIIESAVFYDICEAKKVYELVDSLRNKIA